MEKNSLFVFHRSNNFNDCTGLCGYVEGYDVTHYEDLGKDH